MLANASAEIASDDTGDATKKWGERTRIENSSRFQLADDLTVAGLFEIEAQWLSIRDSKSERSVHLYDSNVSIEMETEMTLHDKLLVEMVVAGEGANDFRVTVEEGFFEILTGSLTTTVGKQFLPFGEFSNLFAQESLVEGSEIQALSVVSTLELPHSWTASLFGFHQQKGAAQGYSRAAWGAQLGFDGGNDFLSGNLSYVSDFRNVKVVDALDDGELIQERHGGWTTALAATIEKTELRTGAGRMRICDTAVCRTDMALTIDLGYRVNTSIQAMVRFERGRWADLARQTRYGVGLVWAMDRYVSVGVELLRFRYNDVHAGLSADRDVDSGLIGGLTVSVTP